MILTNKVNRHKLHRSLNALILDKERDRQPRPVDCLSDRLDVWAIYFYGLRRLIIDESEGLIVLPTSIASIYESSLSDWSQVTSGESFDGIKKFIDAAVWKSSGNLLI